MELGYEPRRADRTCDGMNEAIRQRGLPWCAYGLFSAFHLHCGKASPEDIYAGRAPWQQLKGGVSPALIHKMRAGMLLHGVDIIGWPGGVVSAVHTDEDVRRTLQVHLVEELGDLLSLALRGARFEAGYLLFEEGDAPAEPSLVAKHN